MTIAGAIGLKPYRAGDVGNGGDPVRSLGPSLQSRATSQEEKEKITDGVGPHRLKSRLN